MNLALAPRHVIAQSFIDSRVDRRRLILGQRLFPDSIGALRRVG